MTSDDTGEAIDAILNDLIGYDPTIDLDEHDRKFIRCRKIQRMFIPKARAAVQELIRREVIKARQEQIMQDELSLEFLTDDIGQDVFTDESLLIKWREDQLAALSAGEVEDSVQ